MKKMIIIGVGTAGTLMLNKLHRKLKKDWEFTIIDKDENHYYQPGYLFIPFGIYKPEDVVKKKKDFYPKGTRFLLDEVLKVEPENNAVVLSRGETLFYDVLIIATGTQPVPEETPGLKDKLWYKDIFDFYTFEGASELAKKLESWEGGRLVINLAESIIKCPIAPLEFAFLADSYFTKKGMRHKVEITYTTPLPGAFTKPIATKMLSGLMKEKNITVIPDFYVEHVDNEEKKLVSYDAKEVPFDLLVSVPVNMGSDMVENSDMGDEDDLGFIPTDKHTLQSRDHENIFVIGDATNLPTSKAGSVAHFEGEILEENILSYIRGEEMQASFDGHANCFIETGFGKATLIDFNYDHEPYPGKYPFAGVGPMGLLKVNRANHWGKLLFEWVYWHMMLTGKKIPVSHHYSLKGKKVPETKKAVACSKSGAGISRRKSNVSTIKVKIMEALINGINVDLNEEGYFTNPSQWTREIAIELAAEAGIELTDKHFEVLEFLRDKHNAGVPLTIRKVGKSGIVDIKQFYGLFPGGPLKVSSKIAGIPKPVSCV